MSEIAKRLFEGLKNVGADVGAEVSRMNTLATSELAAALFKGDPFVMYGPGQRAAKVEEQEYAVPGAAHSELPQERDHQQDHQQEQDQQHQHEHQMEIER